MGITLNLQSGVNIDLHTADIDLSHKPIKSYFYDFSTQAKQIQKKGTSSKQRMFASKF